MRRNPETAYLVDDEIWDARMKELGIWDTPEVAMMYGEKLLYSAKKAIREAFREVLEILFQAAALVIDIIRTFFLIVLSILGPLAFAISVWDGFQSTLTQWITRYISVYLWLPVSDLFSTVLARLQSLMLQADIDRMQADPNFSLDNSDVIYIVFLVIGIIGYFTIPTVAGWIISAGGMGNFGRNVNNMATKGGALAGGLAGAAAGNAAGRAKQGGSYIGGKLKQGASVAGGAIGAAAGNIAGRLKGR
jgi:conjugative transposon TraJ protein